MHRQTPGWASSLRRLAAAFATLTALAALAPMTATAAAPAPSPAPSSTSAAPGSTSTVTFGLGPASATKIDGRGTFGYAASPGSTIDDHVALVNISGRPLQLVLYGTDAMNTPTGAVGYQSRGAAKTGAAAWLALPELNGSPTFTLPARRTLILPFQLRIPSNATPGDHTAGIALALLGKVAGKSTSNVTLEQRVVSQVHVRVSGAIVAKLAIENLHASYSGVIDPIGAGSVLVEYTVHNVGNADLGGAQKVTVSGVFGHASAPAIAKLPDLLPGSSTTVTVHVADVRPAVLLKGTVRVTPIAQPGDIDPGLTTYSASTSVWAIPWSLFGLIVLILGLGFGWWLWRRHQPIKPGPSSPQPGQAGERATGRPHPGPGVRAATGRGRRRRLDPIRRARRLTCRSRCY